MVSFLVFGIIVSCALIIRHFTKERSARRKAPEQLRKDGGKKTADAAATTIVASVCKHEFPKKGIIKIFGQEGPYECDGPQEYCADCRSAMAIKCAWCEGIIMIDDAVTLYSRPKEFVAPAHAVLYEEKESKDGRRRFVGCMGWNCASSGVDRQGFWGFPGKVRRTLSPIEEMLLSGKDVAISNPCKIDEAIFVRQEE